jgi:hypothetical protein
MGNAHTGIFVNNNSNHVTISGCVSPTAETGHSNKCLVQRHSDWVRITNNGRPPRYDRWGSNP